MHLDKMKITKSQLKQIVKEEILGVLGEQERPAGADPAAALASMLDFMAERMLSAYDDEIPPPLQKMVDLIKDRDYETVKSDHNLLWTELVQYHRDTGIPLTPRVSNNFKSIRSILSNL